MIKKKSHVRKYSRKVKNKKVKCSRKVLRGGSRVSHPISFTIPEPFTLRSHTSTKWRQTKQEKETNSNIIRKLQNLYNCAITKKEEFENFEKYEYESEYKKTDTNPKTRYLYRKINADKEINEVFNVYELTNTSIGIEYNKNKKKDEIGIFYEISLIDLNVDLIQLAINTNSLSILKDTNDGNSYLGFTNNFPALVYNTDRTSFTYTSRTNAKWTNVYEDNTFNKDDEFVIKKKETNAKYLHPSHKPEFAEQNKITNQALYMQKYTEIKERLISGGDIKDVLIQDIFRMRVKVECENDESLADLAKLDFIISQNINWLLKNALWLEKYLQIRTVDSSLTSQHLKTLIGEKYESDLSDLDEHYIIVDETTIDGVKYVICGYPEKKMKEIILNFWQEGLEKRNEIDINFCDELKKLHKLKETLKLLIEFYNFKEPLSSKNIKDNTKELYKFFSTKIDARFKNISKLFTEFYENNKKLKDEKEYKNFIENYLKNAQNYYNEIAKQYFYKIMTTIRYIFIVFIKNIDDTLRPMIFNIKELEKKHIPILERLNKLVKNELPYRFGIIEDEDKSEYKYNPISSYDNKEEYNSNNEYKLFYSSYKYGNFFHINTEYIHTMGNIYRKDYEYKQSITLEEIIYACSVNSETNLLIPYWKEVKINYNVREYGLSFPSPKQTESRSDIVYDKYDKSKEKNSKEVLPEQNITTNKPFDTIFNNENIKNLKIKIIMIYKINIQSYKIILKYTNTENIDNIYILSIESSIVVLIDNIIKKLYNNIILNKISKIITFNDSDKPIFFKVISIDVITEKDYKKIFTYNPIILYYINQHKRTNSLKKEIFQNNLNKLIPKDTQINNIDNNIMNKVLNTYKKTQNDIIDTSIYYMNAMLNVNNIKILSYLINIYNIELYKIYPWIVKNFLEDTYYNNAENYKNNLYCNNRLYYSNKFTGCDSKICNDSYINCVYYNINNCGYDFIETIDNQLNKIVIYIIPSNLNTTNQTHNFLSNINDVDFNSKQMIFELDKLYLSKNSLIFTHTFPNIIYFCLHFHIINTDNYKREKHFTEKGTYIIQDIFTTDIIKNLNTNSNYYRNSNYSVIRQQ